MTLQSRLRKLERKIFQTGLVFILLKEGETKQQALMRCHSVKKTEQFLIMDEFDIRA